MALTTSDTEYEAGLTSAAGATLPETARERAARIGAEIASQNWPDDMVQQNVEAALGADATDLDIGLAVGVALTLMTERSGGGLDLDVKVHADPMLSQVSRVAESLSSLADAKRLPPEPMVLAKYKFRVLCMDVLGHMHDAKEPTRIAEIVIGGVYSGHIAFRRLREAIDRNVHLTPDEWAFCHGLCAGFMVDFLPRVRG